MPRSQHMSEPSLIAFDRRSFIKAGAALAGSLIIDVAILQSQTTGLSSTIRAFWLPLRQAGAVARSMLIDAAARQWSVDASACHAQRGSVVHAASSRRLTYGELVDAAAMLQAPARDSVVLKPLDA